MTLSYRWLLDYLPEPIAVDPLSEILTSVGLEVEQIRPYEEIRGGLAGLVVGEVMHTEKHPNADKLTLTKVHIGEGPLLSIVCGAPNVATGQKVIVAPVGITIFPTHGDPIAIKKATIRGTESQGMICAEDEIGWGDSHAGIMVLPADTIAGTLVSDLFLPYSDTLIEIGLTPNRMDAMSHWGVARDVCAYMNHHYQKNWQPCWPDSLSIPTTLPPSTIQVRIENTTACPRYSGLCIDDIRSGPSPRWMQQRLKAIGVKPINNIVDITNYVLHETGQPLHAFDRDCINGQEVVIRNVPEKTEFITLDGIPRKLSAEDLLICDTSAPLCLAGVYGGAASGVSDATRHLFLESAYFDAVTIRKTSFAHQLRTDAAQRFEKGTDVSATIPVLQRAAYLISEIAQGKISFAPVDCYPHPLAQKKVSLSWAYLKKISGRSYPAETVTGILKSLGFSIEKADALELIVAVPYHKPDVLLAADLVEEILRIDGLDQLEIPGTISMTPAVESPDIQRKETLQEKISNQLAGMGFHEIMTNSITNRAYFLGQEDSLVTMINSLSSELNTLRPSLLHTALEVVRHNLNHRNLDLRLFEFGNTYLKKREGCFVEEPKLCLVLSGQQRQSHWQESARSTDFFSLKGTVQALLDGLGIKASSTAVSQAHLQLALDWHWQQSHLGQGGQVADTTLRTFGIKQPVYYAEFNWQALITAASVQGMRVAALPRFPSVERDLALVVPRALIWKDIQDSLQKIRIKTLRDIKVFDIFESDKLGTDKKSIAMNLVFSDPDKTLTDKEIETEMQLIIKTLEKEFDVTVRK